METACFNSIVTSPESDGQLKVVISCRTIFAINKKRKAVLMSVRMGLLKLKNFNELYVNFLRTLRKASVILEFMN